MKVDKYFKKEGPKDKVLLRIDPKLKQLIKKISEKESVSLTKAINNLLNIAVDRYFKKSS